MIAVFLREYHFKCAEQEAVCFNMSKIIMLFLKLFLFQNAEKISFVI